MKPSLKPGDRIVVKFKAGPVMGYFMSYYNDYVTCTLDDEYRVYDVERRRVSKAPTDPPPVANIQIFEATKRPEKDFWAANNQRRTNPTNKEA